MSTAAMAAALGISRVQLWRLEKGRQEATARQARQLYELSSGEITPNDLVLRPETEAG